MAKGQLHTFTSYSARCSNLNVDVVLMYLATTKINCTETKVYDLIILQQFKNTLLKLIMKFYIID